MSELPDFVITMNKKMSQEDIDKIKASFDKTSRTLAVIGQALFTQVGKAVKSVGQAFQDMLGPIRRTYATILFQLRCAHGGNQEDAARYPREWVSTICGAWLCLAGGETCPSDQYGLGCHCTCHEGGKT